LSAGVSGQTESEDREMRWWPSGNDRRQRSRNRTNDLSPGEAAVNNHTNELISQLLHLWYGIGMALIVILLHKIARNTKWWK
jgi:hypothetical protein